MLLYQNLVILPKPTINLHVLHQLKIWSIGLWFVFVRFLFKVKCFDWIFIFSECNYLSKEQRQRLTVKTEWQNQINFINVMLPITNEQSFILSIGWNMTIVIVLFISLEKDKLIFLWKAVFNLTAAKLLMFSSVFLNSQICFVPAMLAKYWVQATFVLIIVHKNSNQALQDLIQYLEFL